MLSAAVQRLRTRTVCPTKMVSEMAKSLRSKRRRMMRSEKRKKNAPKELKKLLHCVGQDVQSGRDVEMKDLVTVKDGKELVDQKKSEAESMEVASKYNPKTLLDENGHYPEWMNKRRMHKLRDQRKKSKKKGKSNPKW